MQQNLNFIWFSFHNHEMSFLVLKYFQAPLAVILNIWNAWNMTSPERRASQRKSGKYQTGVFYCLCLWKKHR